MLHTIDVAFSEIHATRGHNVDMHVDVYVNQSWVGRIVYDGEAWVPSLMHLLSPLRKLQSQMLSDAKWYLTSYIQSHGLRKDLIIDRHCQHVAQTDPKINPEPPAKQPHELPYKPKPYLWEEHD